MKNNNYCLSKEIAMVICKINPKLIKANEFIEKILFLT